MSRLWDRCVARYASWRVVLSQELREALLRDPRASQLARVKLRAHRWLFVAMVAALFVILGGLFVAAWALYDPGGQYDKILFYLPLLIAPVMAIFYGLVLVGMGLDAVHVSGRVRAGDPARLPTVCSIALSAPDASLSHQLGAFLSHHRVTVLLALLIISGPPVCMMALTGTLPWQGDAPLMLLAWYGLIALQLALPFGAEFTLWRALSRRA